MDDLVRVDRLTEPPVVGQHYLVPTVRWQWNGRVMNWPVIGPKHTDERFFNFAAEHYHIDARFVRLNGDLKKLTFSAPLAPLRSVGWQDDDIFTNGPLPPPEYRPRKCVSALVPYPFGGHDPVIGLNLHYAGHQCARGKGGWICPHQKASLGSITPVDGWITCPLHGLRINAETGVAHNEMPEVPA